ncbi:MAG TPA: response regulator [Thermoanaerobaculia bacterium]|jgi:CheY-like chemotaxis protein|nr:response regulator [Thermoanaerobaculia bacterium]
MLTEPLSLLIAAGPLPVEEVVRIGRDIASSLTKVHGELFPLAITVSPDGVLIDPPGRAERSQYGPYSAPERILGSGPSLAGDVFSIGTILFHAVAGHSAFRGETAASIMMSACTDAPLPVPANVPRALAAIILRCLATDPGERYASPSMLREALERVQMRDAFPGRRILAADDDPAFRALFQLAAAKVGVDADVVASGREAINAMKARRYDVTLMDLNMPHLSGWEVLDFLRSHWEARPRRLFIITGFRDQDFSAADRGLVTAALYKPIALDDLRALVTASLGDAPLDVPSIVKQTKHRVFLSA